MPAGVMRRIAAPFAARNAAKRMATRRMRAIFAAGFAEMTTRYIHQHGRAIDGAETVLA